MSHKNLVKTLTEALCAIGVAARMEEKHYPEVERVEVTVTFNATHREWETAIKMATYSDTSPVSMAEIIRAHKQLLQELENNE